jgi:N6-L-threonylcarbamoyladenine synthase
VSQTTILAIESSCDDTGAAVIRNGKLLSNVVAGQEVHRQYGGVVPELASRAHQEQLIPVVQQALRQAGVALQDLDAIACTKGPGLMGALLVGTSFSKALALSLQKPLLGVNHMQAHILAHFIESPQPEFPFICLTVSGGHTQLVRVDSYFDFVLLGQTRDDAAGEAFDKIGKLLGLPYPAGPQLDRLAQQGNPQRFVFPEANMPGLDFSFSGLKSAVMYFLQAETAKNPAFIAENLTDLCASIQACIVQTLVKRLQQAAKQTGIQRLAIAGGVSANSGLRQSLQSLEAGGEYTVFIPDFAYCTDNAAMVAITAHYLYQEKRFETQRMVPEPRLALKTN